MPVVHGKRLLSRALRIGTGKQGGAITTIKALEDVKASASVVTTRLESSTCFYCSACQKIWVKALTPVNLCPACQNSLVDFEHHPFKALATDSRICALCGEMHE